MHVLDDILRSFSGQGSSDMPPLVVRMLNRVNWFYFVVKRAVETKNVNFFSKYLYLEYIA